MELERDIRIVAVARLDDEQCIEPGSKPHQLKLRLDEHLRAIPELQPLDESAETPAEYVDGLQMKRRFVKSAHMVKFTNEQDRLIEITEPMREQAYIDVHKHYPIASFDLYLVSARIAHKAKRVNEWWSIFQALIPTSTDESNDKHVQLLCAPAFSIPLPKQTARQAASLIKFYEMFKASLFSLIRLSSASVSLLSTISHVLPVIELSFRPAVLDWFDERVRDHPRLNKLREKNCLCLVAAGSKNDSFRYDFAQIECHIVSQFNASEWQLDALVKRFAIKHLRCTLDNQFLRTSLLWLCEMHELDQYHHIFEVWVSFMRDVCRKRFLSHYFLEGVNVYEEHVGLLDTLNGINYKNIDAFVAQLEENLIFPYAHPYNDRLKQLMDFYEQQPVLAFKMKMVYNVLVKSQFAEADCSLHEMCSVLCHLSFLEDDDKEHTGSFWQLQWQPLFVDLDRDDIVVRRPALVDYRPDHLAQQMTASVFKLIQMDIRQMLNLTGTVPE